MLLANCALPIQLLTYPIYATAGVVLLGSGLAVLSGSRRRAVLVTGIVASFGSAIVSAWMLYLEWDQSVADARAKVPLASWLAALALVSSSIGLFTLAWKRLPASPRYRPGEPAASPVRYPGLTPR